MPTFSLLCLLFAITVRALYTTAGSPCSATCKSNNGTWWTDLVCADSDFASTSKGQLLQVCLECQGQSLYTNGTKSDEYWYLFHMKYTQQTCLIDTNVAHSAAVKACSTECSPLRTVLETLWINKEPWLPQYNYCTDDSGSYPTYAPNCAKCLQAQEGAVILGNFVDTMGNACKDQPSAYENQLVATSRDVFNDTVIPQLSTTTSIASPTVTGSVTTSSTQTAIKSMPDDSPRLSTGAAAGIGAGVAVAVISVVLALVFLVRRHRRSKSAAVLETHPQPYVPNTDVKYAQNGFNYQEMHADSRVELYGHEMVEADGRAWKGSVPVAELSAHGH